MIAPLSGRRLQLALIGPALAASVVGAALSPSGKSAAYEAPPPPILSRAGFEQKLNAQVPLDLTFTDDKGRAVKLGDYFQDKPVILNLAYYECPMLCTLVINGMADTMKSLPFELGRDYTVVTISFDARETPDLAAAKKAGYVAHYGRTGAAENWPFLTGTAASITQLTDAVGFTFAWDEASKQFAHASGIMIATPSGRLSHYFYGIDYPAPQVRLALVDASAGRIGSPVDRILLFCYHYDPVTGKYSMAVMNLIRLGAVLTVSALAIFLIRSSRRRKNRPPAEPSPKPGPGGAPGWTGI